MAISGDLRREWEDSTLRGIAENAVLATASLVRKLRRAALDLSTKGDPGAASQASCQTSRDDQDQEECEAVKQNGYGSGSCEEF